MNTILVLFLVRVCLPICILMILGEWTNRHEADYWLHM